MYVMTKFKEILFYFDNGDTVPIQLDLNLTFACVTCIVAQKLVMKLRGVKQVLKTG